MIEVEQSPSTNSSAIKDLESVTPSQFLTSIAKEIEVDQEFPMDSVNTYINKIYIENQKRDESAPRNEKPPDLRLDAASSTGDIAMKFTSKMDFPRDLM